MTCYSSFEHRLILLMKSFQAMRHPYESRIYTCLLKEFEKWYVHSDADSLYNILSLHVLLLEENCLFRRLLYEHCSQMWGAVCGWPRKLDNLTWCKMPVKLTRKGRAFYEKVV